MSNFGKALDFVLRWEGGFSDHPDDRGGRTNFGITEAVFHDWLRRRGSELRGVETITRDDLTAIYSDDYWMAARCEQLPTPCDLAHFDAAVNTGVKNAVRILQRALASHGDDIAIDGMFGPKTLSRLEVVLASRGVGWLHRQLVWERMTHHTGIVARSRSQAVFLRGWTKRIRAVAEQAGAWDELTRGEPE